MSCCSPCSGRSSRSVPERPLDWKPFAGLVLLGFLAMLHPSEMLHLTRKDLVFPSDTLGHTCELYIHLRNPKTARRQHGKVDDAFAILFVEQVFGHLSWDSRLFPASMHTFRRMWDSVLTRLQIPCRAAAKGATPSVLRGSGATFFYQQTENLQLLAWRGRWARVLKPWSSICRRWQLSCCSASSLRWLEPAFKNSISGVTWSFSPLFELLVLRSKLETEGLRRYSYASAYSFGSTAMPLQFLLLSALQLCLCSFFWLRELLVQQTLLFRAAGARDNLLEQAKEARDASYPVLSEERKHRLKELPASRPARPKGFGITAMPLHILSAVQLCLCSFFCFRHYTAMPLQFLLA